MSDEELENVVGGTVGELKDLSDAISENSKFKLLGKIESHVPGINRGVADTVEKILKEDTNIDANISLGFLGTSINSSKNTYRDMETGQYITHSEVLERIKQFS